MTGQSASSQGPTYCFGDCRFIPDRQMLLHGDVPLRVGSRALDLLHALVQRPGDLVSKEELIRFAWPHTFVDESNLKVNMAYLRRAFAQPSSESPYIATVTGRGYRFVAPLQVLDTLENAAIPDAIRDITGKLPVIAPLIGREEAKSALMGALAETRLLTIVGPAGVGKTSLAVAMAEQLREQFKDGVCFVDLATIEDQQFVAPAIAFALGLDSNFANSAAALSDRLRDRNLLLLLDNCEHVLNIAAALADRLIHALPDLHIVATSREPLRCRGESLYRLAPLLCPVEGHEGDAMAAMAFPAVELLVRRAQAHGYQIAGADTPILAAISRRLDGIALALELAAPRVAVIGADALLAELESSFEMLTSSENVPTPRHTTLKATLNWSYNLLSSGEARILRHLSVFSGTFTLEDVVGAVRHLGRAEEDVAAWLDSLAAKSLLSVSYRRGRRFYRLLDSARSFAGDRLAEDGEHPAAMAGYACYLLSLFEQAEMEWGWRTREAWIVRYGHWGNDLRRAIEWALGAGGNVELGVRLTAAAIPLWHELSSVGESRVRLGAALNALEGLPARHPTVEMKLMAARAINLCLSRKQNTAEDILQKGLRLADDLNNVEYRIRMSANLAGIQFFTGRGQEALATLSGLRKVVDFSGESSALPDIEWHELMIRSCCGDLGEAHEELSKLASQHATVSDRSQISRFAIDRYVAIRTFLVLPAWTIGQPRQGFGAAQDSVEAAAALHHSVSYTYALSVAAIPVSILCGFLDVAQQQVTALFDDLASYENECWPPFARFYQSFLDAARGAPGGLAGMRLAFDEIVGADYLIHASMNLGMLAEAALSHDQLDIARAAVVEALDYCAQTGEHWYRPELLRLRGMVRWREGDASGAGDALDEAVQAARKSGALSFELRSAISRAELTSGTGRFNDALNQLSTVYGQLDSDFHSVDLVAARGLLREKLNSK